MHVPPLMLTRMRMLLLKATSLALGEGTICWEALAITRIGMKTEMERVGRVMGKGMEGGMIRG